MLASSGLSDSPRELDEGRCGLEFHTFHASVRNRQPHADDVAGQYREDIGRA